MSNSDAQSRIPRLTLFDMTLVSVYYRAGKIEAILEDSSALLEGNIRYSFTRKKKNSFVMKSVQEIKVGQVFFRVRHEARFTSDTTISKELFDNDVFQRVAVNRVLPFGSELFASLTGKTLSVPIVVPPELPENAESDD
jgi:hypothetical protein